MQPTSDDFEPRRDGLYEHRGTWAEVTVGTLLAVREKRSQVWEVVDIAMGTPVQPGNTLWMRARERTSGELMPLAPRLKTTPVWMLTEHPADTKPLDPVAPSDADAIMLLVKELGAETMASRDNETGEIVCPDYIERSHIPGTGDRQISRGLREHMALAHAHPVDENIDLVSLFNIHGQAHDPRWPNIGKGGFPHRHVPDVDLSLFG